MGNAVTQQQLIETPTFSVATNTAQQLVGQDSRRVYLALWNAPTPQTVYISSSPDNFASFNGKAPVLWGNTSNGPVLELWPQKCGRLVTMPWFIYPTGMPGSYLGTVIEWLEWEDGRDDGILLPPFSPDPHTTRPGIDFPDRMQQLVSDLMRMRGQ